MHTIRKPFTNDSNDTHYPGSTYTDTNFTLRKTIRLYSLTKTTFIVYKILTQVLTN